MWEFLLGFLLGIYFWWCYTHPRTRRVTPGIQKNVLLPHQEDLELHQVHGGISRKVRVCLGETGIKHRIINHLLPGHGSWDSKSAEFLRDVNPAGTVPVLVHKGHPVYESKDQIIYIDQVLAPGGSILTPQDPQKRKLMDKWVDSGNINMSDMNLSDPWTFLESRADNIRPMVAMPLHCASISLNAGIWFILKSFFMLPVLENKRFVPSILLFKMFGVTAFQKVSFLRNILGQIKKAINHHFSLLTKDLEAGGGPYICGDQYTLADVSMVPLFERMEDARWWTEELKKEFPLVTEYWERIRNREGYKAVPLDSESLAELSKIGKQIDKWKTEHSWFNEYYHGVPKSVKFKEN